MCISTPLDSESWLPGQPLEIIYVRVYRLIYGSIALDFSYGKENEKNAILYWVYTGLYSIQIHDFISIDETCTSGYIPIWASTRLYIRLWTLYICVQVRVYVYIRICDILQKHSWPSDSNRESHAYCNAALTTLPPALILTGVSYDICLLNWGSSLSLGAFWLMSDVLCWAGSTPAPAMMCGFAKRGFKFKQPWPALPGCQWVPCDSNLSQPAISESKSLCAVWLGKITETIHLLPQMCTSHKTRCKTYF
jgi:hypothetical protein